jgi:hypothetical protein
MTNEEILGGLKSAINRGESLKRAMMTFYNAGYKKEEIEEAARVLNERPVETQTQVAVVKPKQNFFGNLFKKKPEQKIVPKEILIPAAPVEPISKPSPQVVSSYGEKPEQKPVQKISSYEKTEPASSKDKILIAVLITILIILFAILAGIFLFKQQIINFFSNLLG